MSERGLWGRGRSVQRRLGDDFGLHYIVFSSLPPGRCQSFPNGRWQLSLHPPAEVRASETGAATWIYNTLHLPGPCSHRLVPGKLTQRWVGQEMLGRTQHCPARPLASQTPQKPSRDTPRVTQRCVYMCVHSRSHWCPVQSPSMGAAPSAAAGLLTAHRCPPSVQGAYTSASPQPAGSRRPADMRLSPCLKM